MRETMKWFGAVVLLGAALGCGPSRTATEASRDLRSGDAELRLKAARDIEGAMRAEKSLPEPVVEALFERAGSESDFKTRASILITLGYTGDTRAKPLLDEYAKTQNPEQRRYAARALKKYAVKTGALPDGYDFPDEWPYGTDGYPPPLPK
jgi:HEAT repeat protein